MKYIKEKNGLAALPTVVVIAIIVLVAGLGVLGTGMVENALTFGEKESREALYAAETGAHDATLRLLRNKDCNNGGTPSCSSYALAVGDASVNVTVVGATSPKIIASTGVRQNKTRQIKVTAEIDSNNKVTITSWVEVVN
ncbi:MAG: hypothetical protein G01um101433_148 [Parcubacteria group bacterium Gr01-1014_33]|nr:MAG: hypothetical protein G01um101433_148 [Parcubacteria group bacterium Gr01-1014_33]